MSEMVVQVTPFNVKEFHSYSNSAGKVSLEREMNDWFESLAVDKNFDYDIRQVLAVAQERPDSAGVLVFYERTPSQGTCDFVCASCQTPALHVCGGSCDNDE